MNQLLLSRDARHILVPWRQDLSQILPHAKSLTHDGVTWLVFPNGRDEAKVARNLGLPVPPPIMTRYDWPSADHRKPWAIQQTTAALLTENARAYVLNTMGTGKTRATLWAADWLRRQGLVKRVLVAAPLSTLSVVWESEIFRLFPGQRAVVLHGDRPKRRRLLAEDAEWHIINHHGLDLLGPELLERGFDVVVIDELAVFRNRSTALWKGAARVVGPSRYAWGLTGSPTPHAPTDAWAQIKLLTPGQAPRTMRVFREWTMREVSQFKYIPRQEANEIVRRAMQPSVRFVLDDVMELPPTVYRDCVVQLDPPVKVAYDTLVKKMRIMTNNGASITAVNEGVLRMKLLQVALGYIYTDNRTAYQLPGTARLDALKEVVGEVEADRKIIVFVPFIHALEGVAKELIDHGEAVEVVHGSTSRAARDRTFRAFQNDPTPRILVAHPQCMAHGLTLTAANTVIWFGPPRDLEVYEQANARIVRPSQTSKTLIVHMTGTPVERLTYKNLRAAGRMQDTLLQLFRDQEVVM